LRGFQNHSVEHESGPNVEDTAGVATSATNLAEAAQGEVDEVRRAVAERWVVDHLDDEAVWLKPSVLDAAGEVYRRAHEDGLEEIEYLAAKGGPPIRKEELAQHEQDCARLHREFLGDVVRRTATAAVASKDVGDELRAPLSSLPSRLVIRVPPRALSVRRTPSAFPSLARDERTPLTEVRLDDDSGRVHFSVVGCCSCRYPFL
jgi:hypothetical protein